MKIEKNIPIPIIHSDGSNKFHNGENSYKWKCIRKMLQMQVGDSIKIKDRTKKVVRDTWLWRASRKSGFRFIVKSINKSTQRVWRIK